MVIKPNSVSTKTTFKGECGVHAALLNMNTSSTGDQNTRLWSDKRRLLTGPDLCFCQNPKIEGMKKNEHGNGDVLLCISQVAVILSP